MKIGVNNSTFHGYFDVKGQEKVRASLLFLILEKYPQIRRDWLFFGDGEPLIDPNIRMTIKDGSATVDQIKAPGPVTLAVAGIEQSMEGADELDVMAAVVKTLSARHKLVYNKRGGYGDNLRENEVPTIHEDKASYGGEACDIDTDPPTGLPQYVNGKSLRKIRIREPKE